LAEARSRARRVLNQPEFRVAELVPIAARPLLPGSGRFLEIDGWAEAEQVDVVLGQIDFAELTVRVDQHRPGFVDIVDPLLPVGFDLELASTRPMHPQPAR